jgi:hypothetical protein
MGECDGFVYFHKNTSFEDNFASPQGEARRPKATAICFPGCQCARDTFRIADSSAMFLSIDKHTTWLQQSLTTQPA